MNLNAYLFCRIFFPSLIGIYALYAFMFVFLTMYNFAGGLDGYQLFYLCVLCLNFLLKPHFRYQSHKVVTYLLVFTLWREVIHKTLI